MTGEAHPLWMCLSGMLMSPRPDGRSQIVSVTSSISNNGTSHVARTLALLAAQHFSVSGQRVLLVDFDLDKQSQGPFFSRPEAGRTYGEMQGPYDATFGQTPFWQISPNALSGSGPQGNDNSYCQLFLVGQTGLAVTQFDWAAVKSGQKVLTVASRNYWQALRDNFGFIIVDCPAYDRTDIGLQIFPEADKTVLVSQEHRRADPVHSTLFQTISNAGGHCAGLILNTGMPAQAYSTVQS